MPERRSALSGYRGATAADGPAPVAIAAATPAALAMVTAFPPSERSVRTALKTATSLAVPKAGRFAGDDDMLLAALSPGRCLLLSASPDLVSALRAAIGDKGAVTDLGHARAVVRITGEPAERLLMTGVMLDLSDSAFPAGLVAETVVHHMDVTLLRRGAAAFDIVVFRGFAVSLLEWLTDAAAPIGFEVRTGV